VKTLRSILALGMLAFCAVVLASNRDQEQKFQQSHSFDGNQRRLSGRHPSVRRSCQGAGPNTGGSVAALCWHLLRKLGKTEARKAYERIVREFGDQHEVVAEARTRLQALTRAVAAAATPAVTVRQLWAGPTVDFLVFPVPTGATCRSPTGRRAIWAFATLPLGRHVA